MSLGGVRATESLGMAISTPTERLQGLERELDDRAGKSVGKSRLGVTPEPRGRSNSASRLTGTQPIEIRANSKSVKTTVGFGASSFTKTGPLSVSPGRVSPKAPTVTQPPKSPKHSEKSKDGGVAPPKEYAKKPKLTKAERRELQEKQRAAKALASGSEGDKGQPKKPKHVSAKVQADDRKQSKQHSKKLRKAGVPERQSNRKQVELFSHLRQADNSISLTEKIPFGTQSSIHPAIVQLGLRYAEGHITGSTARCVAMYQAFKEVIQDYSTPPGKDFSRTFTTSLSPLITFLSESRPLADSMGNAIKHLKHEVTKIPTGIPEEQAKESLITFMDKFIQERIVLSQVVISDSIRSKIQDDDVFLIHGCSSLMSKILKDAYNDGKRFRVIIVDSRPRARGHKALTTLLELGIRATYVHINSISYIMKEVSKVFLTAHALLANGYVMGRVGTSVIAMMARVHNVPVLVACETYKFSERVQTDSFVYNELGDPRELVTGREGCKLDGWEELDDLKLLNLVYDVTPPEFVDMVVTDLGMVPCTSVPVVLRVKELMKQNE